MTAKFYETHFEDYLNANEKKDLHPKLNDHVLKNIPSSIEDLSNIIVYGPKGIGKYTQVLKLLKFEEIFHNKSH